MNESEIVTDPSGHSLAQLAPADRAFVVELGERLGITPPACFELVMAAKPPDRSRETYATQIDPQTNGFASLYLVGQLGSLTELPDLSSLGSLRYLDVRENRLEQLDVARIPRLRVLLADNNKLSRLVAPAALHLLEVPRNRLVEIDLSAASELDEADFTGNPVARISCCDLTLQQLETLRAKELGIITTRPASARELHDFVDHYNWDDGFELLLWAVKHPSCDFGTALMAYWRSDPGSLLQKKLDEVEAWERERWEFLRELEARAEASCYRTSDFPYDPVADGFGGDMDDARIPACLRCKIAPPEV